MLVGCEKEKVVVFIPSELVQKILVYAIENDFQMIPVLQLVCREMLRLSDLISKELSVRFFGKSLSKKLNDRLKSESQHCCFFKLAAEEIRRLEFGSEFMDSKHIPGMYQIRKTALALSMSSSLMDHARKDLEAFSEHSLAQFDFKNMIVTENALELATPLRHFIIKIVNARVFEVIEKLYTVVSNSPGISLNRIADAIYWQAITSYIDLEFIQLMHVFPIDINRPIVSPDINAPFEKIQLFRLLVESCNLELIPYFLDMGANMNQVGEDGKSILQVLEDAVSFNNKHLDCRFIEMQYLIINHSKMKVQF